MTYRARRAVFEPLPYAAADEEPGLADDAPVPLSAFVFSGTAAPLPDGADEAGGVSTRTTRPGRDNARGFAAQLPSHSG